MTITTTPSNNVQSTRDTPKDILEIDISQGLRNTPKGKLKYSTTPWDMNDLQEVIQDEITFSPKKQPKKVSQPKPKTKEERKPKYYVPDIESDEEEEEELRQVLPPRLRKIPEEKKSEIPKDTNFDKLYQEFEASRRKAVQKKVDEVMKLLKQRSAIARQRAEIEYKKSMEQLKMEQEMLSSMFSKETEEIKLKHEKKVQKLKEERQTQIESWKKAAKHFDEKQKIIASIREQKQRDKEEEERRAEEERKKREEEEKLAELNRKLEEQNKKMKEEEERKRLEMQQEAERQRAETTLVISSIPPGVTELAYIQSQKSLKKLERLQAKLNAKEFKDNPDMKKLRIGYLKKINVEMNKVSMARIEVQKKTSTLVQIINEAKQRHQLLYQYCLNMLAEKFVTQGAVQISTQPRSAFAYATISVQLCIFFPELTDILLGQFYTHCPYTIPQYLFKGEQETQESFFKRLQYREDDESDTGFETRESYFERMAGMVTLYAAILQTPVPPNVKNPHGIENAWRWLASLMNIQPTEITATLLEAFLRVAGFELQRVYGLQFVKLVAFLKNDFSKRFPTDSSPSAVTNLELYISDFETTRQWKPPEGRNLDESTGQAGSDDQ